MKTTYYLTFLLFFSLIIGAHAQTQRETRNLGSFDAVKISNSIKAELVRGDQNKVEITVLGIEIGKVETSVVDGTLEVRLARGNFRNHTVEVVVTYVDIQGIEATTSATVIAKDKIVAEEAYLFSGTSAYLEANMEADVLNIEAATNAKIYVEGKVDGLGIRAFTNAEVDAKKLIADNVEVLANTAATVYFRTNGKIQGSAATAAKVYYTGNPKEVNVKTSTGGNISKN
jgi:hypothetical protein